MLRRPRVESSAADNPPTLEIEVTDVTRLECVLDTGLALSFDLGKDDSYTTEYGDGSMLVITLGNRFIQIARSRILYTETRPEQMKRVIAPA